MWNTFFISCYFQYRNICSRNERRKWTLIDDEASFQEKLQSWRWFGFKKFGANRKTSNGLQSIIIIRCRTNRVRNYQPNEGLNECRECVQKKVELNQENGYVIRSCVSFS